jgi:hypothetical protein
MYACNASPRTRVVRGRLIRGSTRSRSAVNPRQFVIIIGDMKGRMLLDRFALPLREGVLQRACVEALAVVCIGSPLAKIIAVGAEAADEEVTGGFDAGVEVEPFEHAREGRDFRPRVRGSRFEQVDRNPEPAPHSAQVVETEIDAAIALCGGDTRAALRATLVANAFLEAEVERLSVAVSSGFARGRVRRPAKRRSDEGKTG